MRSLILSKDLSIYFYSYTYYFNTFKTKLNRYFSLFHTLSLNENRQEKMFMLQLWFSLAV